MHFSEEYFSLSEVYHQCFECLQRSGWSRVSLGIQRADRTENPEGQNRCGAEAGWFWDFVHCGASSDSDSAWVPLMGPACCCPLAESGPALCDPMAYGSPGSTVLCRLAEFTQIHILWVMTLIGLSVSHRVVTISGHCLSPLAAPLPTPHHVFLPFLAPDSESLWAVNFLTSEIQPWCLVQDGCSEVSA